MADRERIAASVRDVILTTWTERFTPEQLHDHQALGAEGLGLDSVEVVEVLFACERACGAIASEDLFADSPLTIGRVIDHLCTAS